MLCRQLATNSKVAFVFAMSHSLLGHFLVLF